MDSIEERDAALAARLTEECNSGDTEADHSNADDFLVSELRRLGYLKLVEAYGDVDKWFA